MHSLQSVEMTLQFGREREASLRRRTLLPPHDRSGRSLRRWIGHQLVRTGNWLASEQPMRPARAR